MALLLVLDLLDALLIVASLIPLGEVVVSNLWQNFNSPNIHTTTFRITTTISNQDDWNIWKFRSGAYLKWFYPSAGGTYSKPIYIKVLPEPTVYEFPFPEKFIEEGLLVRSALVIRASRYLPLTPNEMFASWSLKIEEFD